VDISNKNSLCNFANVSTKEKIVLIMLEEIHFKQCHFINLTLQKAILNGPKSETIGVHPLPVA
jgi:hypothetical protein